MSQEPEPAAAASATPGIAPKPLPNPSTSSASPAASLSTLWGYLQPALDHIVRSPTNWTSKAPTIEISYHMGLHTAVYNYFTSQSDASLPPAIPTMAASKSLAHLPFGRTERPRTSGTDLYEQLDQYYGEVAREIFLGAPHDDAALVPYLLPCFTRYAVGAHAVNRLLNYVNRHYVKRLVDEDKGWLRLADVIEEVARMLQAEVVAAGANANANTNARAGVETDATTVPSQETREQVQQRFRERREEELARWGWREGDSAEVLARAEACAEAASAPDRVVPLSSLAIRQFRIQVIEPLLSIPGKKKKGKQKKTLPADGERPPLPKGRLARAAKELLEGSGEITDERRRLAGELAQLLWTVGVRPDHQLRKKLDKYLPLASELTSS